MPKYQEIAGWLEQGICDGRYLSGQKLPSEQALREQFGVSRQTVRRALEVLEDEGLVYGRQGSGTFVADQEAEENAKSRQIAVVTTYVDNYIFPRIIQGVESVLSREGFQVQISFTNNRLQKEGEILENLMNQELRGLIIEATKSALPNPNIPLYRCLLEKGVQILFLNSGYPELDGPVVALDDVEAGRCAARFLLDMGHTELGGMGIPGIFRHIGKCPGREDQEGSQHKRQGQEAGFHGYFLSFRGRKGLAMVYRPAHISLEQILEPLRKRVSFGGSRPYVSLRIWMVGALEGGFQCA